MLEDLPKGYTDKVVEEYSLLARIRSCNNEVYELASKVFIVQEGADLRYYIVEPFNASIKRKVDELIDALKMYVKYDDSFFEDPIRELMNIYDSLINKKRGKPPPSLKDRLELIGLREALKYQLVKSYLGYEDLTFLLVDDNIEDINCTGPNSYVTVLHRKYSSSGWLTTNVYLSASEIDRLVGKMAFRCGKAINVLNPVLEGNLPEGYRVSLTYGKEVSPLGSSFVIRKFRSRPLTVIELINLGMLNEDLAAYFWKLIENKKSIFIIGPSGAGKTTLLNALAYLINPRYKIVSIEDTHEINLSYDRLWKPLVTRVGEFRRTYDIFDLVKFALRERADYIILGESRGEEARLIFQAMATGHGCITTFHASNLNELLARLESSPISVDKGMINLIDTVVVLNYARQGDRVVRVISQVHRQYEGRWHEIYNRALNKDAFNGLEEFSDLNLDDLATKRAFIKYLRSLNASDPVEFQERIKLYYLNKYRLHEGRWILAEV